MSPGLVDIIDNSGVVKRKGLQCASVEDLTLDPSVLEKRN